MTNKAKNRIGAGTAGLAAGCVNGILGGAGGMVLIPIMRLLTDVEDQELFPTSVSVMLPVCLVSLTISARWSPLPWADAFPYLIGSGIGGVLSGLFGKRIPTLWLHRLLGIMILWGCIRYLC